MIVEETITIALPVSNSVLMDMIRRVVPKLIAEDIVGVQPMDGPVGQIFTMKPCYGDDNDS